MNKLTILSVLLFLSFSSISQRVDIVVTVKDSIANNLEYKIDTAKVNLRQQIASVPAFSGSNNFINRTGGYVSFDKPAIYNSYSSPVIGDVTFDTVGAINGTEIYVYQQSSLFAIPQNAIVVSGTYFSNNPNLLRIVRRSSFSYEINILNTQTSQYINPEKIYFVAQNAATSSTTPIPCGFNVEIKASAKYVVSGLIRIGSSSTGGVNFGTTNSITPSNLNITLFGRSSDVIAFRGILYTLTNGYNSVANFPFNTVASQFGWVVVEGIIEGGASDSVFDLLFSSAVSGQTSTLYSSGSYLKVTKL